MAKAMQYTAMDAILMMRNSKIVIMLDKFKV